MTTSVVDREPRDEWTIRAEARRQGRAGDSASCSCRRGARSPCAPFPGSRSLALPHGPRARHPRGRARSRVRRPDRRSRAGARRGQRVLVVTSSNARTAENAIDHAKNRARRISPSSLVGIFSQAPGPRGDGARPENTVHRCLRRWTRSRPPFGDRPTRRDGTRGRSRRSASSSRSSRARRDRRRVRPLEVIGERILRGSRGVG